MPKRAKGLTAAGVKTAKPGRHGDGDGLYLLVRSVKLRFWVFRWVRTVKVNVNGTDEKHSVMREMGLGPAAGRAPVSLAEARAKAETLRQILRQGKDPLVERDRARAEAEAEAHRAAARAVTFKEAAEKYIAANASGWRNAKHRQQWTNTLATYAYPHIGSLSVADVETKHVKAALDPIWTVKPETASRLRGRIECVLDYAKANEWRTGENPARWRGHIQNILPVAKKIRPVQHHKALPWKLMGDFMAELRDESGIAALALEFTILTAARTTEAIEARAGEFDFAERVWTVPAARMKARRGHRVPLCDRAIVILEELAKLRSDGDAKAFIFPGGRRGKSLSNGAMLQLLERMGRGNITVHGFRSAFKDWAAESTKHANIVSEAALAHVVGDKTEAAYRRGDLVDPRRELMDDWAQFCSRIMTQSNILPLRSAVGE